MSSERRIKVAIVGGGCASMTAAFELSRREHHGKYQVTVYQQGWRLGGKGASGRGPANRIEEHGFHVWFGFYENAFRIMRECYAELGRDRSKCRIADWRDAFLPAPFVSLPHQAQDGSYSPRLFCLPPGEGLPGDPVTEQAPVTVTDYLMRAANLLRMMLLGMQPKADERNREESQAGPSTWAGEEPERDERENEIRTRVANLMKYGSIATVAGLVEATGVLQILFKTLSLYPTSLVIGLLEATLASARRLLETLVESDPQMLMLWQSIELVLTSMLGIVRFGLISNPRGFDAINAYDFREWLRINGCSTRTLDSPMMRVWYDMAFAYEDGDHRRPSQGAGIALRGGVRLLFGYRGAPVWKMNAGMGDVVFAPLYELLKQRGVTFQFFHRLENVKLANSGDLRSTGHPFVEALEFDLQATVKQGEYKPLIDVDGLPCWPSQPDYSQLVNDEGIARQKWNLESHWDRQKVGTRTLRVIDDFDFVVLGVGLGAIPYVCREFVERDQRWREMVARVKTAETQAFQIWLSEDLEKLGWNGPSVSMCGFVQPFESWGEMSHLVREERWLKDRGAIAYFVSTLKDSGTPPRTDTGYVAMRHEEVRKNAIYFLNHDIVQLLPKAAGGPEQFLWELLVDAENEERGAGEARFDSQYWRANVNPTDRYVLSVPGSQQYRISPLDNTYDNLTVAGDWTACGLDVGCVEAAVISGRLAAHALSSVPALEDIVGYDHP